MARARDGRGGSKAPWLRKLEHLSMNPGDLNSSSDDSASESDETTAGGAGAACAPGLMLSEASWMSSRLCSIDCSWSWLTVLSESSESYSATVGDAEVCITTGPGTAGSHDVCLYRAAAPGARPLGTLLTYNAAHRRSRATFGFVVINCVCTADQRCRDNPAHLLEVRGCMRLGPPASECTSRHAPSVREDETRFGTSAKPGSIILNLL